MFRPRSWREPCDDLFIVRALIRDLIRFRYLRHTQVAIPVFSSFNDRLLQKIRKRIDGDDETLSSRWSSENNWEDASHYIELEFPEEISVSSPNNP